MGRDSYDVVVVGGGFFGIALALEARRYKQHVLLVEAESELMSRASYANQARVHQGYHYPRSLLTAERSRVNFSIFQHAYAECVVSDFHKLYAIARDQSKVSAGQFLRFCERIGAPIEPAPQKLAKLFDPRAIEAVFTVQEYAFDALKLRTMVEGALHANGVEVVRGTELTRILQGPELRVELLEPSGEARHVATRWLFNSTYANLNQLLSGAGLEPIPLKHEFVEIALVRPPPPLDGLGITVLDGPFFSCMPFPSAQAHSFTHVRYTPHETWLDGAAVPPRRSRLRDLAALSEPSLFLHMVRDAARFVPRLSEVEYVRSLWEIKTLLPQSERDDSRPILFRQDRAEPRVISILGAKIDNVIDMCEHVEALLGG